MEKVKASSNCICLGSLRWTSALSVTDWRLLSHSRSEKVCKFTFKSVSAKCIFTCCSLLSISVKERCHCKTAMQYRWICEFLWCDFVIKLQKMSNVIFYSSIHFLQMSVHFQTPKLIGPIYRTISVICWSIGFNNSWYMKNVKSYTLWVVVCPPEGTEQILCRQRSYLECHHQMRINLF